jgi:transmembrane sensor
MKAVARLRSGLARFSQWSAIAALDQAGEGGVRHWRAAPRLWLAAAAVIVVSVTIFATLPRETVIRTELGERRERVLADGSEVIVAPNSRIRISLSAAERLVILDRGQAYFHVSKDPNRPFIVDAGPARTRAVGTWFSVERSADSVVVTVAEGRVAVRPISSQRRPAGGSADADPNIYVGANEQVAVAGSGTAAPVREINGKLATAWLQGQLVFDNDKVADVVKRFNLYNHVQIRVMDERLAARPVTGVFRATDPGSFVAFLQSVAQVEVREGDAGEILIESPGSEPLNSPR